MCYVINRKCRGLNPLIRRFGREAETYQRLSHFNCSFFQTRKKEPKKVLCDPIAPQDRTGYTPACQVLLIAMALDLLTGMEGIDQINR